MIMRLIYTYFILNCHAFYTKTRRTGPLENAIFCVTFVFAQLLISISVLVSKLLHTSAGTYLMISLLLTFLFHISQKRWVTASFLSKSRNRFNYIYILSAKRNIIVMITPSLLFAFVFLITMIILN